MPITRETKGKRLRADPGRIREVAESKEAEKKRQIIESYKKKVILTEAEKKRGYKSVRLIMPGKIVKKTGEVRTYYFVNPQTGERTGTMSGSGLANKQLGGGAFDGTKYVHVAPDVELQKVITRQQETNLQL